MLNLIANILLSTRVLSAAMVLIGNCVINSIDICTFLIDEIRIVRKMFGCILTNKIL